MMYVSKGILCKRKRRQWILIRQYDCLIKLFGEEAAAWEKGRLGFAYTHHRGEINVIQNLMKKGSWRLKVGKVKLTNIIYCVIAQYTQIRNFNFALNSLIKRRNAF